MHTVLFIEDKLKIKFITSVGWVFSRRLLPNKTFIKRVVYVINMFLNLFRFSWCKFNCTLKSILWVFWNTRASKVLYGTIRHHDKTALIRLARGKSIFRLPFFTFSLAEVVIKSWLIDALVQANWLSVNNLNLENSAEMDGSEYLYACGNHNLKK